MGFSAAKGALPVAFVVREASGDPVDDAAVRQWALDNGPAYQHPRAVWFVDELPLTASNKVRKPDLREMATRLL